MENPVPVPDLVIVTAIIFPYKVPKKRHNKKNRLLRRDK